MHAGCYSGYEGAKGYYGVYYKASPLKAQPGQTAILFLTRNLVRWSEVFETLAQEEREAKARRQDMGDLSSDEEPRNPQPEP